MRELITLVTDEATKLREHATKEELARLDIYDLNGMSGFRCIYGQMTGYCYCARAVQLLNICARPYSVDIDEYKVSTDRKFAFARDFSPIEYFIHPNNSTPAQRAALVAFLKGETETLNLATA